MATPAEKGEQLQQPQGAQPDYKTLTESERTPLLPSKRQDLLEDVYDDYHEASVPSAVFNLSTTIVGAGIMALPATMKVLGLPLGILTIIIVGILSENSIQVLLRYSRPCRAKSYGGLMADAFGNAGRVFVQLCIIINNIGILIVYMIIIGRSLILLPYLLILFISFTSIFCWMPDSIG